MLAGWEGSGPVVLNSRTEDWDWQKLEPGPPPHQTAAGTGHDGLGPACQELLTSLLPPWGSPALKVPTALFSGLGSPDSWSLVSPLDHSVGLGLGATRAFSLC